MTDQLNQICQGRNKLGQFIVGFKHTEETKSKISKNHRKKQSLETRKKISNLFKGKSKSEEHKKKLSESLKSKGIKPIKPWRFHGIGSRPDSGRNSKLWKDNKSGQLLRKTIEYKIWRKSVFERDKYKCVFCGKGGYLEADHIKPFAYFPELRFAIDNGRTLCRKCHKLTNTYAEKAKSWKKI